MELTDILFQYLYEVHSKELKEDEEYQAVKATRNTKEQALTATLTQKQMEQFNDYIEEANHLDAIALHRLFSHCSILLLPKGK